jgi:hypothetical protein
MSSLPRSFRPAAAVALIARRTALALIVAVGAVTVAPAVHGDLAAQGAQAKAAPSFAAVRALLDELDSSGGIGAVRVERVRNSLAAAERSSGAGRINALRAIAESLKADEQKSGEATKVKALRQAILDLANAR